MFNHDRYCRQKNVIVVGTIKTISLDTLWYYYACEQCKFKVISKTVDAEKQETGAYFENDCKPEYECANPNCNSDPVVVVPRFRIPIRVQDHTGIASLTLFDKDAFKLLKQTAKCLLDKKENEAPFQLYPEELNDLLERKFAFKIEVSDYNLDKNKPYYTISKLTNDTTILQDLDKKANADRPLESESIQLGSMSGFHSQNSVSQKDSTSFTADNETPIFVTDKVKGKKICEDSVPTKRNHYTVYDVDELEVASSNKGRPGIKITEPDENMIPKLLIPKLEKQD
ncbi:uncharacterized protein LOC143547164 [Bidens hawaiensis]|uniref:uncharacterized protein LOC143547164 n=1 Tax=Bidens hawaiensis TaxID=980011 RepID=UPI00404B2982